MVLGLWPDLQASSAWLAILGALIPYGIGCWIVVAVLIIIATRRAGRLIALLPMVALLLHLVWAHDYIPGQAPAGTTSGLRIAAFNGLYGRADPTETAAQLAAADPDVIVFLEASRPQMDAAPVTRLLESYPHRFGTPAPGFAEAGYEDAGPTFVVSKRPLGLISQIDSPFDQYVLETTTRDNVPLTLIAAHPVNMLGSAQRWVDDAETLAQAIDDQDPDQALVVIGDLNATRENLAYQIIADTGLTDAAVQAGAGWVPTYTPQPGAPPLVQIDHALVSSRVTAQAFSTFTVAGSDHRGIVVDISVG